MNEKAKPTTIFTVLLSDGSKRQHLYETSWEAGGKGIFLGETKNDW